MERALVELGWVCVGVFARASDPADAAREVDLCLIAVPDRAIHDVAAAIVPGDAVVMHLSGATPVSILAPHHRRAGLHPLVALADPVAGAEALKTAYFACGGDALAQEVAGELSGKWFEISDADRALYHGAAVVASNHLVALLGQVERLAAEVGVPFEAFMSLVQSSVDNVGALGARAALTGPAARGDEETIESHVAALSSRLPEEVAAYEALVSQARKLANIDP